MGSITKAIDDPGVPTWHVMMTDGTIGKILGSKTLSQAEWERIYAENQAAEGLLGPDGRGDPKKRYQFPKR